MDESTTFTIINDEGQEIECNILFSFEHAGNGKNYIVYTDNTLDENGEIRVFASVYDPDDEDRSLLPIETEEEWDLIDQILLGMQDGIIGDE